MADSWQDRWWTPRGARQALSLSASLWRQCNLYNPAWHIAFLSTVLGPWYRGSPLTCEAGRSISLYYTQCCVLLSQVQKQGPKSCSLFKSKWDSYSGLLISLLMISIHCTCTGRTKADLWNCRATEDQVWPSQSTATPPLPALWRCLPDRPCTGRANKSQIHYHYFKREEKCWE